MIGVKFPFVIQSGSVAVSDNPPEYIGSQIIFCLGTMTGERVMRSTWGVDVIGSLQALEGDLDFAMREAVSGAFKKWFPDYEPREIDITRNPDNPAYVTIDVKYGRYDSDVDETVRVGTQLPGGTEIYTNEGF